MSEIKLSKENFESVINSGQTVLVDFWASWCGPCMMLAPIVEKIASTYEGKLVVGKVNVDEEMDLAMKYNIVSIPTIIFFKDGQVKKKSIGYLTENELVNLIEEIL